MFTIKTTGEFHAAHQLPDHPRECANLHGHRWQVELEVFASALNKQGMVIDFSDLRKILRGVIDPLDHSYLNDTLYNPTAENICLYIKEKLSLPANIERVVVRVEETPGNVVGLTYVPNS